MPPRGRPPKKEKAESEEDASMDESSSDVSEFNEDEDDSDVEGGEGEGDNQDENDDDDNEEDDEDDDNDNDNDNETEPAQKKRKSEIDDERREKSLLDLLALMEDSSPLIPDAVTDHYLAKAGFECDDVRIKRLLALATQKFIADVAQDAFHYAKIRQHALSKEKKGAVKKTVLTVEDLSGALSEHGINIKKPDYFV